MSILYYQPRAPRPPAPRPRHRPLRLADGNEYDDGRAPVVRARNDGLDGADGNRARRAAPPRRRARDVLGQRRRGVRLEADARVERRPPRPAPRVDTDPPLDGTAHVPAPARA